MKRIFVGSSSGDAKIAKSISDQLSKIPGVEGECWTDAFPLGLLTFEALERMLRHCVAAVFIVSAETHGLPNENVMIELGLVAGRMGRTKVALCICGKPHLPSDLLAVTRIDMGDLTQESSIPPSALERLTGWAKPLPAILEAVPCTEVVHGYSGRWRAVLSFSKWRTLPVSGSSVVALNADLFLQIPACGHSGSGLMEGKLIIHWEKCEGDQPKRIYTGSFGICASVSDVVCDGDGGMTFRTQTLMRQLVSQSGKALPDETLPEEVTVPWLFNWKLKVRDNPPASMEVEFVTDVHDWSDGKGAAYRESSAPW